jgi:hypothetical protein
MKEMVTLALASVEREIDVMRWMFCRASWTCIYRVHDLGATKDLLEIRWEMNYKSYTNHMTSNTTKYISNTTPDSRSGGDVNNRSIIDGQSGEKEKVETNRLTPLQ